MGKSSRFILWFSFLLVALAAFWFRTETYPAYSSHSPRPGGVKALVLLLENEGVPVARLQAAVPDKPGLLFILHGDDQMTGEDWESLLEWTGQGNTLFWAGRYSPYLFDYFGFEDAYTYQETAIRPVSSPHPLFNGVENLTLSWGRMQEHLRMDFAYGDEDGIFLAEVAEGSGRVVLLTQPDLLTNRLIAQGDNLIFFLNVIRLYGREGIWFREPGLAYGGKDAADRVFTGPLRLVMLQLALGTLLLFVFWGKRFGRPVPLPQNMREVSGEYVRSLANIYRQGRARRLILESLEDQFRSELGRYLGGPVKMPDTKLLEHFRQRPWVDTEGLERLLERCRSASGRELGENELFTLARELELWQRSNLRRRPERGIRHGKQ
jgi:hypothetical protein